MGLFVTGELIDEQYDGFKRTFVLHRLIVIVMSTTDHISICDTCMSKQSWIMESSTMEATVWRNLVSVVWLTIWR